MVSLILALAVPQDAIARNTAFMKDVKALTTEYRITMNGSSGVGTAKLVARFPDMQKFTLRWAAESMEYMHSKGGALIVRHDLRQYDEARVFPRNIHPYSLIVGLGDLAYPPFLIAGSLESFIPGGKFEPRGQESINGATCDKVFVNSGVPGSVGQHTFWIDDSGKIVRWNRLMETMSGTFDTTVDFTSFAKDAPTDPAFYKDVLPAGYMPNVIPITKTRTVMLEELAIFGKWLDARTNSKVDVAALAKNNTVLVVFTDPDCELSKAAEPLLDSLRRSLKPKGCALIEVSLGTKKPDLSKKDKDRNVYWDKDGAIEAAYGIPGTPYFLMSDKSGTLVRGWQGYAKGQDAAVTQTFLGYFKG
jgi:hypothetical protein